MLFYPYCKTISQERDGILYFVNMSSIVRDCWSLARQLHQKVGATNYAAASTIVLYTAVLLWIPRIGYRRIQGPTSHVHDDNVHYCSIGAIHRATRRTTVQLYCCCYKYCCCTVCRTALQLMPVLLSVQMTVSTAVARGLSSVLCFTCYTSASQCTSVSQTEHLGSSALLAFRPLVDSEWTGLSGRSDKVQGSEYLCA